MKTRPRPHDPAICVGCRPKVINADGQAHDNPWYSETDGRCFAPGMMNRHGGGKWLVNLRCPDCGREAIFNENFIGRGKKVLCDGRRFIRPHQQTLEMLVRATDRANIGE